MIMATGMRIINETVRERVKNRSTFIMAVEILLIGTVVLVVVLLIRGL